MLGAAYTTFKCSHQGPISNAMELHAPELVKINGKAVTQLSERLVVCVHAFVIMKIRAVETNASASIEIVLSTQQNAAPEAIKIPLYH